MKIRWLFERWYCPRCKIFVDGYDARKWVFDCHYCETELEEWNWRGKKKNY